MFEIQCKCKLQLSSLLYSLFNCDPTKHVLIITSYAYCIMTCDLTQMQMSNRLIEQTI